MMDDITVCPFLENIEEVTSFVERVLKGAGCSQRIIIKMNIAVDELFSNIARYSGASRATVSVGVEGDTVMMRFCDDGVKYDPTLTDEPDITLSTEERGIGGLGIYMVKKSMDMIKYEYVDGKNVLTITKQR